MQFDLPEKNNLAARERPVEVVVSLISLASSRGVAETRGDRRKSPIATTYRDTPPVARKIDEVRYTDAQQQERSTTVANGLNALHNSVQHLKDLATGMDPEYYTSSAYPSEWTIADTFSHLGSGAVIGKQGFENSITGRAPDPSFNTSVWDEWNAKNPADQVTDSLASDAAFLAVLEEATEEERGRFSMSLGPFAFDFAGLIGLRLGEHVLHTWDVEVPFNPDATLSSEAADAILNNLQFVAARAAKPHGVVRDVAIRTSDPVRTFTLVLSGDAAELREAPLDGAVDLEIPAEAFVRLVYGRLDPGHTPASVQGDAVELLRSVYPGL